MHETTAIHCSSSAISPAPFLNKTYDMVDDPTTDSVVSWTPSNNSFVVWNVPEFSRSLLPKHFKHNNFSSFVRQLNTYGFRKVDPDRWEFANEGFLRGRKHLLKSISRRKPAHVHSNQQQPEVQNTPVGACVEVGKFGLEEEVERLKRDKNVLMQELVRLRQQQQTTDGQLHSVGQRVQIMEQRQQQMLSFLAKAMQSPGFLTQLVQHQNESNRRITGVNKKRRLPKHEEEEHSPTEKTTTAPNRQIVKYQPLINEAAKSMARQILKINASPRFEPTMSHNVTSPSNALESGTQTTSSSRVSGVTLFEVPTTSGQSSSPKEAQFSEVNVGNFGIYDGEMPIDTDEFPSDTSDLGLFPDEIPPLPGLDDGFWEQFLSTSPLTGDSDDIDASMFDGGIAKEKNLDQLSKQMGLLTSETNWG